MTTAMSTPTNSRGAHTARGSARWSVVALVLASLATSFPAAAPAATATAPTKTVLGVPLPASARVTGALTKSTPTTPAPSKKTPAATTPATSKTTPATTSPLASGAQPGTVAPATTTPASARTPATPTATPTATTPTIATPTHTPSTASSAVIGVARKAAPKSTRLSTGALALVVFGALLILGCLAWALSRWLALEPRWTVSLMHSLREASYHASATWAEFADWLRLGH